MLRLEQSECFPSLRQTKHYVASQLEDKEKEKSIASLPILMVEHTR